MSSKSVSGLQIAKHDVVLNLLILLQRRRIFNGNGVKLFNERKNVRPVQFERLCRRKNKCDLRNKFCSGKSRKHCGKRRKCW